LAYIPFRIRTLRFRENLLVIEYRLFSQEEDEPMDGKIVVKELPKEDITLIYMALIRSDMGSDKVQPSKLRQMIRRLTLGEASKDLEIDLKPKYRERVLIDIFTRDNVVYRIDTDSFNYRDALGKEAGYVTQHNLRKFVALLLEKLESVKGAESLRTYLEKGKRGLKTFSSLYEFQDFCRGMSQVGESGPEDSDEEEAKES